jgi:hypothetical protein
VYVAVFADQAGTIKYNINPDGVTFRQLTTTAVAASTALEDSKVVAGAANARVDYTNGAAGQATFQFGSIGSAA